MDEEKPKSYFNRYILSYLIEVLVCMDEDQMGVKVNRKRIWIGKLIHTIFGNGFSKFVYDNFGGERRYKVLKYLEEKNGN